MMEIMMMMLYSGISIRVQQIRFLFHPRFQKEMECEECYTESQQRDFLQEFESESKGGRIHCGFSFAKSVRRKGLNQTIS